MLSFARIALQHLVEDHRVVLSLRSHMDHLDEISDNFEIFLRLKQALLSPINSQLRIHNIGESNSLLLPFLLNLLLLIFNPLHIMFKSIDNLIDNIRVLPEILIVSILDEQRNLLRFISL